MKPFRVAQRKKNLQLKKSSFNLKDFFSKIIESPDKMYPKLETMLNKNSDTLHAFIELGGLSKIYEYLQHYYRQNDFFQIVKWLKLLNHDNFPIDVELIKTIGLGNFLSKQIKTKSKHISNNNQQKDLIKLTSSIEQKWYKFAKKEKQEYQQRDKNRKRVSIPQKNYKMTVSFKKYDKPSMINNNHKKHANNNNNNNRVNVESILKCTNNNNNNNIYHNHNHNQNRDLMEFQDQNDDKYELEYVEMEDNDIEMDGNQDKYESTDDDDDDIDLNSNNYNTNNSNNSNNNNYTRNNKEIEMDLMEEEIVWYQPVSININESQYVEYTRNDTVATKEEEERIKDKDYNIGPKCVELESAKLTNNDVNNNIVQVLTDYPHWSEIDKYRKENGV